MTAQTILPANTLSSGYNVANSAKFDIDGTDTLRLAAAGSDGDKKHWTISMWIKRSKLATLQHVWSWSRNNTNAEGGFYFDANDQLVFINDGQNGSSNEIDGRWRDTSAWMHLVWSCDADNGTNANRWKVYVNGVQKTITGGPTISDANGKINEGSTQEHWIGGRARSLNSNVADASYFSGYLAEVVFIDDATLDPTSFGEFDEDSPTIWKPIDVSGLTFGAEGYYLDFQNAAELGTDVSGNSNTLAENSMDATNQSTDTCTNNYATLNPLTIPAGASLTLSEGNLQFNGTSTDAGAKANFGVSSGKWYWEVKTKLSDDNSSGSDRIAVVTEAVRQITSATDPSSEGLWAIQSRSGSGATLNSFTNGTFSNSNSGSTGFNNGTIIGVALDADNGKIYYHKDGTYTDLSGNTGDPANGTNPTFTGLPTDGTFLFPYFENRPNVTPSSQVNFGGTPPFSISSGNSDANGYGNFEHSVPSGYYALNSKNLAEYG